MSKFAKDGNNFRREWDKEAFEKKAKERLDAELALEEDREHAKTAPQPIVQRAPLQRRTEDLQLAKFVGSRQVVTGAQAMAGQMAGSYYCNVCECPLRDSANYLLHINGRKHNRMLGMSMRAERSTVGEVRARLEAHKGDRAEQELPDDVKAERFLQEFDERLKQREAAAHLEAVEKRKQKKEAKAGGANETEEVVAAPADDDMLQMGFGFAFGGSKKNS
ncbi:hypothetical protein AB1Y20_010472 [Prymnesium parvum]|uniref:U1-type domain-containing protein n=1 Tax=Prymnesium parvum TaxID=97485 RepID=A0AB34IRL2_PRYPA|mmetsp:Transcript_22394/g.55695  ORF Transcript_22394/g.55695 Transcript_22394/m.55695 type:complete len:220 (+) Transcript_22394:23-682(+)